MRLSTRWLSAFLAIVLCLSFCPVSAFALDLGGASAVGSEAAAEEPVVEEAAEEVVEEPAEAEIAEEEQGPPDELVLDWTNEVALDGASRVGINNTLGISGQDIVAEARTWAGTSASYWSASSPWPKCIAWRTGYTTDGQTSFDCCGFVSRVLNDVGLRGKSIVANYSCVLRDKYGAYFIDTTIAGLLNYGTDITAAVKKAQNGDYSDLLPGDIIGWIGDSSLGNHIIIYAGLNGSGKPTMIEFTGDGYKERVITSSYQKAFQNGARLVGSTYLSKCTKYATYLDLEITGATTLKKYPCSKTTDATSTDIYTPSIGETFVAYALWENTVGNFWYEVKYNGTTCYLFAGDAEVLGGRTDDVVVSGVSVPTELEVGERFSIKGTITSTYGTMSTVQGYIFAGSVSSLASATTDPIYKVHKEPWVNSYSLLNSDIDLGLLFNELEAGRYTYMINVVCPNYYSPDGSNRYARWNGREVIVQEFTVGNVTPAYMSASRTTISLSENTPSQSITFNMGGDLPDNYSLRYVLQDENGSEVSGSPLSLTWGGWNGDSTSITATLTETANKTKYRIFIALFETGYPDDVLSSVTITVNCEPIRPAAPETFVIKPDKASGKPVLCWLAVEDAVCYNILRSTTGEDGPYSVYYTYYPDSLTAADCEYIDPNTKPGVKYYYIIHAENEYGIESGPSNVDYMTCDYAQPNVSITTNVSTGKPKLTWAAVDGATEYEIWRATSSDGTYTKMYTTSNTYYNNTNAVAGRTYYYKVRALGDVSAATSAFSTVKSITCDYAQPVVSISCVATTGKPRLSWSAVSGATKYEIWRATSRTGTYTKIYTTSNTYFNNTTAEANKSYYYKVRAIGSSSYATSAYSSIASITCDCARPVVSISCKASTGKPVLTWGAVNGAVKYEIWRAYSKNGTYYKMGTTTGTTYTNTGAEPNKTYYYKVYAVGSSSYAKSAASTVVNMTCDCARPVVSITTNSSGKPRLSWKAVDGAVRYEVWRADYRTGTYTKLGTTTGTTYTNTSAKAGYTYFYKVRVIGSSTFATSAYSSIVSAKATK